MGTDEWREEDDWPLGRAKATRYYLRSTKPRTGLQEAHAECGRSG